MTAKLYFGMKDHTAISHAMKKINEIIENDILGMSEGIITAKEFKEI